MSSREKILNEIRQNKPEALPLPTFLPMAKEEDSVEKFTEVLQGIGGKVVRTKGLAEVQAFLAQQLEGGVEVVNGILALSPYNITEYETKEATAVEGVHTVLLHGHLAVAENGAVWVPEKAMVNRLLPFLTQQLVLVVEEKNIVANMHQAYENIQVDEDGYGAFIAGPSKTADIEQSLVIGAHGPLTLTVIMVA